MRTRLSAAISATRHGADPRQGRRLGAQSAGEFVHVRACSLHLEKDCAGIISDEPGQPQLAGDAVDERTESDPLDNTGHGEALPDLVGS